MNIRPAMEAAVGPMRVRNASGVREHEVLRISATIQGAAEVDALEDARREVLAWTQNRCGGKLPPEAWNCEPFEYLAGGRNSLGARLKTDDIDIWGIRAEDPDKSVPGRVWTTEVTIGGEAGKPAKFSVRQIVNTTEQELIIKPHAPGLVRQIIDRFGIQENSDAFENLPWNVSSEAESHALVDRLIDRSRSIPYVVFSGDERSDDSETTQFDTISLSEALAGLAQIAFVPAEHTRTISSRLGQPLSVYHGGVRYYNPGVSPGSDRFQHPLFLGDRLRLPEDRARAARWICVMAANDSLRRHRIGRAVVPFGDIRNASLIARQNRLATEGASDTEQLAAAKTTLESLEKLLSEERQMIEFFDDEATKEKERAEAAEEQLRSATYQIALLRSALASQGQSVDETIPSPDSWETFVQWVDRNYSGRISLTTAARRKCKDAAYADLDSVARCFQWLATTYIPGRIDGADHDFRDFNIESGIRNSLCGGDEFETEWQGRKHLVDWHIKNGGNTRDPIRCLRIYYFWEPVSQQVVVADMPGHRRTNAT